MKGHASDDGVPQFSPAITVVPVSTLTGSPARRLGATQAAASGSTDTTAVPACAGIPATHRGYTSELVFLTGQQCESKPTPVNWSLYGPSSATLVIFMGVASLAEVAGSLLAHGRPASCLSLIHI